MSDRPEDQTYSVVDRWDTHGFYSLYNTGVFSDCKVVCGNNSIKGHICILASACAYFEKALCGNFKEASERTLDLSEDSWMTVNSLIKFAYGCPVSELFKESSAGLIETVQLYGLADRLGYSRLKASIIPHLKTASRSRVADFKSLRDLLTATEKVTSPVDSDMMSFIVALVATNITVFRGAKLEDL
ncbi:BTB/POZ and MATH domain-containing protein 6 [Sphaceloma murrayae]|uniref:BTB/POZ and MATH domain-containing protein 6 n=1 Tax=Sphaceloma murrayae TaxID=2082308 RepID=A0A2K1QZ12_9PEZI|nr:BTB/POZ and MATH domain-containing protein 6 [Sphaceloma murrayae]